MTRSSSYSASSTSYTATRLQLPRALSHSLTVGMYIGSGPLLGVGYEARLLEGTWCSIVAPPDILAQPDLLELGAEVVPGKPIPVAMEGYSELDYVLEPDEMDF